MTREFEEGAKLGRLRVELEQPGGVLAAIGAVMVAESQASFKKQEFGSTRWDARGSVNVMGLIADFAAGKKPPKRRFETRPALRDTGRLAASIAFRVTGRAVEVGTNVPYASIHQTGGESESKPITEKIQERIRDFLKKTPGDDLRAKLGFLLRPEMVGKTVKTRVRKREFLGVTKQTQEDIAEVIRMRLADG